MDIRLEYLVRFAVQVRGGGRGGERREARVGRRSCPLCRLEVRNMRQITRPESSNANKSRLKEEINLKSQSEQEVRDFAGSGLNER